MTTTHPLNIAQSNLALSSQGLSLETQSSQSLTPTIEQDTSEIGDAITTFMGGISGLMLTLSLILFLQAPLISGIVLFTLVSGWGGSALYQARQES